MNLIELEKYSNGDESELSFIHIGKCGGATVREAIKNSTILREKFTTFKRVHSRKPYYQSRTRYLFVIRNPIKRCISAFNWRYHLVVESKQQEYRFSGEYEVLNKYKSLKNLAENLYDNEKNIRIEVVKEWLTVHHLKEDVSFYLTPLISRLKKEQVFAILTQENLNDDIRRYLGVTDIKHEHRHGKSTAPDMLDLSAVAKENLRQFLSSDYNCIRDLLKFGNISQKVKLLLLD